jgi:hypothetical protein
VDTVDAHLELAEEAVIELPPSLLPKGCTIEASYICEGKPNLKLKFTYPTSPSAVLPLPRQEQL